MEKWNLGYKELLKINPRLIYASITGFGQVGPNAERLAFDAVAQAMGGIMSITGYPNNPPTRVGTSLGDINAGNFMSTGILAALYQRERTGKGQNIDISMQDCIFAILENAIVRHTIGGENPTRIGSGHATVAPYDVFTANDGYVIIACANDATWQRLCLVMGQQALIADERFVSNPKRAENRLGLYEIINTWVSSLSVKQVLAILEKDSVPAAPVLTIAEVVEDEHLKFRKMLVEVDHPTAGKVVIPGNPIKLGSSSDGVEKPAPLLGQHTQEVLLGLGYTEEQIQILRQEKVI